MIIPTNGRIVWYTPYKNELLSPYGMVVNRDKDANLIPLAAMVCAVHGDRMVNLIVFDANGHMFPVTSRALLQDDDQPLEYGGYCQWMPYQKQVASGQIAPTLHVDPKVVGQ